MTKSPDSENLLDAPVQFGPLTLHNRWAMAPIVTLFPEVADRPTPHHIDFYANRARSRPGLVIVGATYVSPEGKGFPNQMGIDADDKIPGFRELAAQIQRYAPAIVQLFHAGPKTSRSVSGHDVVAPSAAAARGIRYDASRALTDQEIHGLFRSFEGGAWRAHQAGFAGVELHGANGYLLNTFSDPEHNHRTDKWNQPDAFPASLVGRLRQRLPDRFLIGYTLSPFSVNSTDIADVQSLKRFTDLAGRIKEAGANYIHVYRGKAEHWEEPRAFVSLLREHGIDLPVVEGAGVRSAAQAQFFIQAGATLVAVGRALLGCPDLLTIPEFEYPAVAHANLSTAAGVERVFTTECQRNIERVADGEDDRLKDV